MQQTLTSKRLTLVEKQDYRIDLEYNKDYAILHLPYVNGFNRNLYEEAFVRIEDVFDFMQGLGYDGLWAAVSPDDIKIQKFIDRLGFAYHGKSDDLLVYHLKGK